MKTKIIQVTAIGMSQVKLLKELNTALLKAGYDVHCIASLDEYEDDIRNMGVHFHPIKIDRSINVKNNIQSVIEMVKVFGKVKPDIVHVHTPVAAVLARIAAKISGIKNVVYTAHGFYFHEGMKQPKYCFYFMIEKYFGQWFTDWIFTQSKEDYQLAVRHRFADKANCVHISNGIDIEKQFNLSLISEEDIQAMCQKYHIKKGDVVFSFLGRLVEEKGILELLEAFVIVHRFYPATKLIIMGKLMDSERDLNTAENLEQFKECDGIYFVGQVACPEHYYYISDVFILPSYREGMPLSIIEAMAMKNAVIATNIRGTREEITHGENGYLTKVKSVTELVEYMRYLIEHPEKIESMKLKGYEKVQREYNEKDVVCKQLDIFNMLAGRR